MTRDVTAELQWGRSFEAAETWRGSMIVLRKLMSFNGAAALRLRKRARRRRCRAAASWLQWGRSFEAAETNFDENVFITAGNLQWGRSFEAAETT